MEVISLVIWHSFSLSKIVHDMAIISMMRTHKHTNGGSEREPKVMHDNMHILFQLFAS